MSMPTVHIRREAFLNMIMAATETFKRECLGILFGHSPARNRNNFLITNAVPIQCVRIRLNSEVDQSKKSVEALHKLFGKAEKIYRPLGDFHSHPEWGQTLGGPELSESDIKNMIYQETKLEIVIVISSRKRGFILWETQPDGSIKGSLSKFNYHFNAYTLIKDEEEKLVPQKLQIVAPLALRALNRVNK